GVQRWQNRVNGFWAAVAGGCNLNRDIPGLLAAGGFEVSELQTQYLPGTPRIAGYNFWGRAHRAASA
ncbi:MAG TPA: SAM-dependent methyltransferase, partial [Halieaceae bacterium]|nr:SAM-dependent methyltransferase [Halieaceae bacterium]